MTIPGRRRFLQLPRTDRRVQRDVDDEIRFDLDMRTRELVDAGVEPDEARAQAVREFGDLEETRRYCAALDAEVERESQRAELLRELRDDVVLAWRAMRRTPGFALVVLITLGLGIGANTAVFSVVRRILVDRLPYAEPEQLVRIYAQWRTPSGDGGDMLSPAEVVELSQAKSFSGVAAFGWFGGYTYTDGQAAEMWQAAQVAPNFFPLLGVRAAAGRMILDRDVSPGAPLAVVVSYRLWQRAFGADPSVVGRIIHLSGRPWTIIGVAPPEFVSPGFVVDAWMSLNLAAMMRRDPAMAQQSRSLRAIGRVRDGASLARVRAEMSVIAKRAQERQPELRESGPARIVPLREAMVGSARPALLAVMGAAGLVLVITCINIAGLFLSRAASRRRELAVRSALGAGRGRLIRQLLTESALYGLGGGAVGIALAFAGRNALATLAESTLPHVGDIRIDLGVLAFAAAVSLVCGLAFGVSPAVAATRVDLRDSLNDSTRGASQSGVQARGRRILVSAQIALAVVLMIGAGLLLRSFAGLTSTNLGYSTGSNVLTFRVNLPSGRFDTPPVWNTFFADFTARIRAMPGVQRVGLTAISPWNGPPGVSVRVEGQTDDDATLPIAPFVTATEEFFGALGIPVVRGRSISRDDRYGAPGVAVISQSLARRLFRDDDPIGKRLRFEIRRTTSDTLRQWREIVGVVGDIRGTVTSDPEPTLYVSNWQEGQPAGEFVVQTSGDATALIPAIRQTLHEMDPQLPLILPRSMRDVLHHFVAQQWLAMTLMGVFALLALTLAALGVYAVMAYAVAARTREFGIRSALGARRGSLVMLVLRQGMVTAVVGTAIGIGIAALASRLIEGLLTGVSSRDGVTFVLAPATLLAVTLLACMLPARTATRVQPVDALRSE